MTHYQEILSQNLKRIRKEKKLSQLAISEKSGVITSTFSRVESCKISPNLSTLEKLAEAMEVPMSEFFSEEKKVELSILEKLEKIDAMSEYNQQVLNVMFDTLLEKDRLEKSQDVKMKSRLAELEKVRRK